MSSISYFIIGFAFIFMNIDYICTILVSIERADNKLWIDATDKHMEMLLLHELTKAGEVL